ACARPLEPGLALVGDVHGEAVFRQAAAKVGSGLLLVLNNQNAHRPPFSAWFNCGNPGATHSERKSCWTRQLIDCLSPARFARARFGSRSLPREPLIAGPSPFAPAIRPGALPGPAPSSGLLRG